MGRAKALNFGLSKCSADYVAILDADDVCLPHRVEAEIAFLDDHLDVAMVGSAQRVIIDKDDQEIRLDVLPTSSDDLHATLAQGQNPFLHSSVMFRADLVRALGGYDEITLLGFLDLKPLCRARGQAQRWRTSSIAWPSSAGTAASTSARNRACSGPSKGARTWKR